MSLPAYCALCWIATPSGDGCGADAAVKPYATQGELAPLSASSLQALTDGLFEHGLVADAGLFGDPLCQFKIGDRDTDGDGASRVLLGLFHELEQHIRICLQDLRSGGANQIPTLERTSKLALRLPSALRGCIPVGFFGIGLEFRGVSRCAGHNSSCRRHSFRRQ